MYQPLLMFSIILVSSIRCCSCDYPSPRSLLAAIMNYDVWGSFSSTVGPNSPLDDSCAPTKAGSAVSAVKAWTGANFPANQVKKGAFLQNLLTKLSSFFSPQDRTRCCRVWTQLSCDDQCGFGQLGKSQLVPFV